MPHSFLSRRRVLAALGGGVALVAAGGVWRVTRVPGTAIAPWTLPPGCDDIRLDAFRHAILAPNPHNRQPWEIRLVGRTEAIITCDLARRLPETDPFDRQITIGFGAFAELAALAAAERGHELRVTAFPEGAPGETGRLDKRPVMHLNFVRKEGLARDPLFAAIPLRRSSKVPFDMTRPVAPQTIEQIGARAGLSSRLGHALDGARVAELCDLAINAMVLELETPHTLKESIDLLRVGAAEIDANPDGISLKGPLFEALSLLGADAVRRDALKPESNAYQSTLARYRRDFAATPAFVWLTSEGNDRKTQLETGRAYARLNLAANAAGLAIHPVSQALQEYPEMRRHFVRLQEFCGARGDQRVQMFARLGYADPVGPSPRWPLGAKLIA